MDREFECLTNDELIEDLEYYRRHPDEPPLHYYGALFVSLPSSLIEEIIIRLKKTEEKNGN